VKAGDLAFETGSLTLNATNPEGKVVPLAGKYTVVWQRDDDGVWRMHRDIWNIDQTVK
jgi:ketosteroid isomerase-like protein